MDLPRAQGRRQRLDVEPADHQHPAIGHVLDDAHHEPRGVPPDARRVEAALEVDGARHGEARHAGTARSAPGPSVT